MWLDAMSMASGAVSRTCFSVSSSNEIMLARSTLSGYRSPYQAQCTRFQHYRDLVEWLTKPHHVEHDDGAVVGGVVPHSLWSSYNAPAAGCSGSGRCRAMPAATGRLRSPDRYRVTYRLGLPCYVHAMSSKDPMRSGITCHGYCRKTRIAADNVDSCGQYTTIVRQSFRVADYRP